LKEIQSKNTRSWFGVKTAIPLTFDWQYWKNAFTWEGVLVLGSTSGSLIDLNGVYSTYLGNNKIIIDDNEGMIFDAEKIRAYTQIQWSPIVQTPL
jgi:hypothetical protein